MPLLNQKNISTDYYSKETVELAKKDEVDLKKIEDDDFEPITLEWVLEIERTAYARSLEPCSAAEIAEMMAALDPSAPPADVAAPEPVAPTPDVAPAAEWSKNVLPERSKNVSARERRSPANDATIIAKMRTFRVGDDSAACTSLVSNPLPCITPSLTTPISTPSDSTKASAPTPANDNLIPVWSLTGDAVTALSATVALQLSETAAVAFTFNLTPDAIAKAKDSPTDFLDPLKRSFDVELKRVLKGIALPYWFAIDD